jgi:cell division protein YceG involved in septum cleavage
MFKFKWEFNFTLIINVATTIITFIWFEAKFEERVNIILQQHEARIINLEKGVTVQSTINATQDRRLFVIEDRFSFIIPNNNSSLKKKKKNEHLN